VRENAIQGTRQPKEDGGATSVGGRHLSSGRKLTAFARGGPIEGKVRPIVYVLSQILEPG